MKQHALRYIATVLRCCWYPFLLVILHLNSKVQEGKVVITLLVTVIEVVTVSSERLMDRPK